MNCDITKDRTERGIEHNPDTYSPKANKKFRVKSFKAITNIYLLLSLIIDDKLQCVLVIY